MEKPPFSRNEGLPIGTHKIPFFSDNREISFEDYYLTHLATTTKERANEPEILNKRRREIERAQLTKEHLCSNGFSPIFEAHIFHALEKVGNK
jgi:hypothetical protein